MKSSKGRHSDLIKNCLSLSFAFAICFSFTAKAFAQGAPNKADLPPEVFSESKSKVPPPPNSERLNEFPIGDGATAPSKGTAAPVIPMEGVFNYDPIGKRDPFKPYKSVLNGKDGDQSDPLLRFELDQLKVVGILWEVSRPRAMIQDPSGQIHVVIKNSKIGRNEGFVATIREGQIVVVETDYSSGVAIREPRVLELKK